MNTESPLYQHERPFWDERSRTDSGKKEKFVFRQLALLAYPVGITGNYERIISLKNPNSRSLTIERYYFRSLYTIINEQKNIYATFKQF